MWDYKKEVNEALDHYWDYICLYKTFGDRKYKRYANWWKYELLCLSKSKGNYSKYKELADILFDDYDDLQEINLSFI